MIVVIRKAEQSERQRRPARRGHVAAIGALAALAVVVAAWSWTTRQPPQAGLGLPHGVIAVAGGAFMAALIAETRTIGLADVLEAGWDLATGLIKSVFFGGAIGLISCHRGFHCRAGAVGVCRAATEAFVLSFIAILVFDFFLSLVLSDVARLLWPTAQHPGIM